MFIAPAICLTLLARLPQDRPQKELAEEPKRVVAFLAKQFDHALAAFRPKIK